MKLNVIIKDPGKRPRHVHIADTLENLQKTVGGYIEMVTLRCFDGYQRPHDIIMIVNEEGKLRGLPENFKLCNTWDTICGTAIFCGRDGEDLADLPVTFEEFKGGFPELWM